LNANVLIKVTTGTPRISPTHADPDLVLDVAEDALLTEHGPAIDLVLPIALAWLDAQIAALPTTAASRLPELHERRIELRMQYDAWRAAHPSPAARLRALARERAGIEPKRRRDLERALIVYGQRNPFSQFQR
jgi:hypothetical protein